MPSSLQITLLDEQVLFHLDSPLLDFQCSGWLCILPLVTIHLYGGASIWCVGLDAQGSGYLSTSILVSTGRRGPAWSVDLTGFAEHSRVVLFFTRRVWPSRCVTTTC